MADINVKFRAAELGKSLEDLAYEVESELNQAIKDTANAAYASIVGSAQLGLKSSQKDYLKGLSFAQIGENEYLIVLQGDYPNAIEKGFSGFSMRDKMLKSEHVVSVGSRSGQKWVQTGAEGQKYAHVPFEKKPFSKVGRGFSDVGQAIQKLTAMNRDGRSQRLTKIFKDTSGKALEGKVAAVRKVEGFPELEGITKYQKTYRSESGKETTQSLYVTYRTISENGLDWKHPGYEGLKAFDEAEKWVEEQIDNILNTLIK